MSPIVLVINRLGQNEILAEVPVVAVRPAEGDCIVVNRRFEARDDNVHALVAVSVFGSSFDRSEVIGDVVVGCLKDGEEPWSFGDAEDVLFEKLGGDVTGYDEVRQQYVRTIDFGVSW